MNSKSKNATFTLPVDLLKRLKDYVDSQNIQSLNVAVKEALAAYLDVAERERFKRDMEKAAGDPLFIKDIEECMSDFKNADEETARRIPGW